MSTQPCGCECQAIDTVAVRAVVPSQGMAFDLAMDTPEPFFSLPILTLALITAALTLAHQKRRYRPPSIREPAATTALPATRHSWGLRPSPAEKRLLASIRTFFSTPRSLWVDVRCVRNLRKNF